jgi:hypothetical protein
MRLRDLDNQAGLVAELTAKSCNKEKPGENVGSAPSYNSSLLLQFALSVVSCQLSVVSCDCCVSIRRKKIL